MKRRDFLKNTMVVIAGASVPLSALEFIDPKEVLAANPQLHWAFLINTYTCVGCGFCVKACKTENDVPFDANVSRTWDAALDVEDAGSGLYKSVDGGVSWELR